MAILVALGIFAAGLALDNLLAGRAHRMEEDELLASRMARYAGLRHD